MLWDPGGFPYNCPLTLYGIVPSDDIKSSATTKEMFNGALSLQPFATAQCLAKKMAYGL